MKLTKLKAVLAAALVMATGLAAWAESTPVETEIGKDGPKTFCLGPKGEPGSETNPWEVGEGVEAWTNGTELVIQGAGSVTGLTEIPGEVKGGIDAINVASNGVTGVAFDAFQGIDNIALTLPDGWQGELPDEDGNWYGATGVTLTAMPLTVKNVTFQQRYPWNGKVDVGFGLTGPEGETDVIITVRDGETEIANFTAAVTIPEVGILTTNLIWDAANPTADIKSDDVTVEVAFKVEAAQPGQLWKDGPIFAECNVGATKPEEYGYYFWWGDTVGYKRNATDDGWVSVKDGTTPIQFNDSAPANTLYNKNAAALAEYVDANGNLKSDYDAATAHLGAPWRMMTKAELDCLVANCEVEWTDNWNETGIKGTIVKGKGDYSANSIFLTAAGWGYESSLNDAGLLGFYWSSTPNSDDSIRAWGPSFNSDEFCWSSYYRYYGQSVRPVRDAAVTPVISAKSAAGSLDLTVGDRVAKDVETLIADPAWDESTTVTVFIDGEAGAREYTTASKDPWQTTSLEPGRYAMTLAGDECAYSAGFWKLGEDWVVLDGSELTENMVFEAGKTYLVLGTNMVNGKTLMVEDGAKFFYDEGAPAGFKAASVAELPKRYEIADGVDPADESKLFQIVEKPRGSEDNPWDVGDGATAYTNGTGTVFFKPERGVVTKAGLTKIAAAMGDASFLAKLVSPDGSETNDVVMVLGDNGVPYDTLADVFAADPLPETVRLFEVKGANVEFNAMGGVHVSGLEVITNFCIVTYTLPEVERDGYTLVGWFNGWKAEATKVEDGQDLLSYEPHPLYAQWQANNPTPTEGELDIPDVTNDVPVTSIEAKQYVNDTSLKSVTTPLYLQSIGQRAFMGCTSLEKLTITAARSYDDLSPVKVTVGQNAFSGCSSLDTVYIAAEIDNLGQSAFQNCAKLKKIVFLGDDTITYGASAFYRCGYQNGTGSLKVYMSSAFQLANKDGLIADLKRWNTQLKIIEKVDVAPVEGGSISISGFNTENLAANNRRLAILVKTSVQGTPDPDDVDIEYSADLSNWSTLTEGTEKTANPDGTVLIEVTVPEGSSGFFRAVIR